MTLPTLPNWIRMCVHSSLTRLHQHRSPKYESIPIKSIQANSHRILIILTTASFYPQIRCIQLRNSTHGISTAYILFNLISATEHFAILFALLVNSGGDVFIHEPPTTGDWLNLYQLFAVWMGCLVLFCQAIHSLHTNPRRKLILLTIYIQYLCISILPEVIDAITTPEETRKQRPPTGERNWLIGLFLSAHAMTVLPLSAVLRIAGFIDQSRLILRRRREQPSVLSLTGLACQAVVFALVSGLWVLRVQQPVPRMPMRKPVDWMYWYHVIGWPVVDDAVYALGQWVLFWYAVCWRSRGDARDEAVHSGETDDLLGEDEGHGYGGNGTS
ncbi:predicted protein [Aspergillus terreus NIH2624]|uniref:Uncharacterized protein n=1 Tax=Aspergillus terreus (strain NIH 2624 / FGSC A1156) TaxID=341663 RepID=Q0C8M5_ASPTN|nr:uncharacterized protein ATEG_09959 [Aspergillus terreus NIH2624]EAU29408.1 predicted protein [Aspergillus terreus NIH2624]